MPKRPRDTNNAKSFFAKKKKKKKKKKLQHYYVAVESNMKQILHSLHSNFGEVLNVHDEIQKT